MKKIGKIIAIGIIWMFLLPANVHATGGLALTIDGKAAAIMELSSGEIIFDQEGDLRLPPASVTKIMTMLLIYEAVAQKRISWDDIVTTSEHAANMGGSQIYLEPNEQQTVRDLTKAVVIASANDAAVALAEFISGSEESFVDLMNKRARGLGMENTAFRNACGLDAEGHFTTARDIAIMSRELLTRYPEVTEFATTWMDTIIHRTARGEEEFGLTNTNKLVKWYNGTTGLKTGSTGLALYCLSASARRGDMDLIAVILAAPNPTTRFQETMKMLDYGFANYKVVKGELAGNVVAEIPVRKGQEPIARAMVETLISNVTEKGNNSELTAEITIPEVLDAPLETGQIVGEIIYTYEGAEIGRSNLVIEESVPRAGFLEILGRVYRGWFE